MPSPINIILRATSAIGPVVASVRREIAALVSSPFVVNLTSNARLVATNIISQISTAYTSISAAAVIAASSTTSAFSTALASARGFAATTSTSVSGAFSTALASVRGFAATATTRVTSAFTSTLASARGFAATASASVSGAFSTALASVRGFAATATTRVTSAFTSTLASARGFAATASASISSVFGGALASVGTLVTSTVGRVTGALGTIITRARAIASTLSGLTVPGAIAAVGRGVVRGGAALASRAGPIIAGAARFAGDAIGTASTVLEGGFSLAEKSLDKVEPILRTISPELGEIVGKMSSWSGWYDLLVGQNVRLQKQILSVSATLAGTNKVLLDGVAVTDPLKQISVLGVETRKLIDQIRQDSLELVGVTSTDLIENILPVVAGQLGAIGGKISDARGLVSNFAAAFQVLNIPLEQSRQEISSILTAQINSDSTLAKSLNITNEQVKNWQAQGILVDKLNERLAAFRQANKLASQSVDGVTSNIVELFEVISQKAGEPLVKPLVDGLNQVYDFLVKNQDVIAGFFGQIVNAIEETIRNLTPAFSALGERFGPQLGQLLASTFNFIEKATIGLSIAIGGVITAFVEFDKRVPSVTISLQIIIAVLNKAAEGYDKLRRGIELATGAYQDGEKAADSYTEVAEKVFENSLKIAKETTPRVKELLDKQKEGIKLTVDEQKELQKLQARRQGAIADLNDLGTSLDNSNVAGEENQSRIAGLSKETQAWVGRLQDVAIASRDFDKVGNYYQQLGNKVSASQRIISGDVGATRDQFLGANKEMVDYVKQQIDLGLITEAEGEKRLDTIRDDNRVTLDIQDSAQKKITEIQKDALDDRKNDLDVNIKQTQAAIANSNISEAEGQRKLTDYKRQQIEAELELVKKQIKEETELRQGELKVRLGDLEKGLSDLGTTDTPEARKRKKELGAEIEATKTAIASSTDRADTLGRQEKNLQSDLTQNTAEGRKQRNQERLKDFDEQKSISEARRQEQLITQKQELDDVYKIEQGKSKETLRQIEERRKLLTSKKDKEGLEGLAVEEEQVKAQQFAARQNYNQGLLKLEEESVANRQGVLQAGLSTKKLDEQKFYAESLKLTLEGLDAESAEAQRQRSQLKSTDKLGLEAIAAQEATISEKRFAARQNYYQGLLKLEQESVANRQGILQGSLSAGKLDEQKFYADSLTLTLEGLDAELAENQRQRSQLKSTDKQGLDALAAQEAIILEKRRKAIDNFYEQNLQLVERNQQKVKDAIAASETALEINLQNLRNKGEITETQASFQRIEQKRKDADQELALAEETLANIQKLPPETDPVEEDKRLTRIRQARAGVAQATLNIAKLVGEKEQGYRALVEESINKELQTFQNAQTEKEMGLEGQQRILGLITGSLERQNTLLTSRQGLLNSLSGYYQEQLSVLGKIAEAQGDYSLQQDAQQAAEALKLQALLRQQELERNIFEINQQQLLLKQESQRVELELNRLKQESAVAESEAKLETTKADKDSTPQQIKAAEFGVKAAKVGLVSLDNQEVILGEQQKLDTQQSQIERQKLYQQQQGATDLAVVNYATSLKETDPSKADQILSNQLKVTLSKVFGTTLTGPVGDALQGYTNQVNDLLANGTLPGLGSLPIQAPGIFNTFNQAIAPNAATTSLPAGAIIPVFNNNLLPGGAGENAPSTLQSFEQKLGLSLDTLSERIDKLPSGTINITLQNEFAASKDAPQEVVGQLYDQLYNLGIQIQR